MCDVIVPAMHDLSEKTVLVTGASRGIGAATVAALADAGAHVVAHYGRDRAGAEEATASLPPERRLILGAELEDRDAVRAMWREAVAWRGRVDVLVNNAAMLERSPLGLPDAEWDAVWERTLAVNVLGPMALARAATEHFLQTGGGVLITISSWVAQRGASNPDLTAYAASKAAIKAATQTLASAHAHEGLLAYAIAPGLVDTQMSVFPGQTPEQVEAMTAALAMREWVPPSDIADLVAYLASGRCRHLTGATLDVNGASYLR
jgi:NAD(P)-dependent dehydrogenase (short-subunit alcohol dehydrogenase family)